MKDVIIIGGGLAGLISSYLLAKAGIEVLLIEKKEYPFNKVCGEYVSNEVVPFLESNNLYPKELEPSQIKNFLLSSQYGKSKLYNLDLGGFGISRYVFDDYLYKKCLKAGVESLLKCSVEKVEFDDNLFEVHTSFGETLKASLVIGAFGKRSVIDKKMNRNFINKRSPYIGVKYHITTDFPDDLIAIHGFEKGYCGISKIENEKYNLCYLAHRDLLKVGGSIRQMEETFLFKNPYLKTLFKNSQFLFDKPEVINEISFERKSAVENHILMAGDSAGMVAPIFGNGMAMAIHAGKIAAEAIIKYYSKKNYFNRLKLEEEYTSEWNQLFKRRLWLGRNIQKTFNNPFLTNLVLRFLLTNKNLLTKLIENSHGKPF